ncbi:MAG TPA: thioredoxin domain-containing protein [Pseudonocardiaceae bacterium]
MGGAERNERKRRQQAVQAVRAAAAAQNGGDKRSVIIGIAVVAVMAVVVIGGVLLVRNNKSNDAVRSTAIPVTQAHARYDTRLEPDGTVVAGDPASGVTVDIYEDFLCPACGAFEQRDGAEIEQAVADGRIQVRYHVVNLLDELSDPPGYSLDAANAALCAAEAGYFPDFHASLFARQPQEGGPGYTEDQLVELGRALGAGEDFATCVRQGRYDEQVKQQYETASQNPALQRERQGRKVFGTPTVVVDGQMVDLSQPGWLEAALPKAN